MADWIGTDEAAQFSGSHVDYVRRLMRQGKIAAEKKGDPPSISWRGS